MDDNQFEGLAHAAFEVFIAHGQTSVSILEHWP